MLDNPDVQEIASTGALVPLSNFGLSAEGYVQGVVDASTLDGELYGLQPITNSIALFYNTEPAPRTLRGRRRPLAHQRVGALYRPRNK